MSPADEKALLAFSVGPVQSFIAAARSARDLWSGSFLLAHLTRAAMQPVIDGERAGATAFIAPDMIRDPMGPQHLSSPCLPNRFLAHVPADIARDLADQCVTAFWSEWKSIGDKVRRLLSGLVREHLPAWEPDWRRSVDGDDSLWVRQLRSFFDVRAVVLPLAECTDGVLAALLPAESRPANFRDLDQRWSACADVAIGLLNANKTLRHIPDYRPPDVMGRYAGKCSLLGTYEQMGPVVLEESARFWNDFAANIAHGGTRVRRGERLCAVSLVKRFAWAACLAGENRRNPRADAVRRYGDGGRRRVVAAEGVPPGVAPEIDPDQTRDRDRRPWSGQWLHWVQPHQDPDDDCCPGDLWEIIQQKRRLQGRPPAYYAILNLDGDFMGEKLREKPGPGYRRKISQTLMTFALDEVRKIVERDYHGVLMYCGGDDVLALVSTARAFGCAFAVRQAFQSVWQNQIGGEPATVSAGLVFVHFKEDLRFALEEARRAERTAKSVKEKNSLAVRVCRRSGEHTEALTPWEFVPAIEQWVDAYLPDRDEKFASDRWSYQLHGELPTLQGLPVPAMEAEIRRQVGRCEKESLRRLHPAQPDRAAESMVERFREYVKTARRFEFPEGDGALLTHFVTLCQTASFVARGRDE